MSPEIELAGTLFGSTAVQVAVCDELRDEAGARDGPQLAQSRVADRTGWRAIR